jgi:hypothetical protein
VEAGFRYESTLAADVETLIGPLGFARVHGMDAPLAAGIVGLGCDEYLCRRTG